MNLDKVRGQAKHAAWYNGPDDPPNYNPFGKVRTGLPARKNALRNAESGMSDLTRSITDQEDQHEDVLGRQAEMGGAIGVQQRNGTAPISDRSRMKPIKEQATTPIQFDRTDSPELEESFAEQDRPLPLPETKDSTSDDTTAAEDITTSDKPRQRKGLKGMFHRKTKEEVSEEPEDDGREKPIYTFGNQIRATLFNSWINILLIAGKPRMPFLEAFFEVPYY